MSVTSINSIATYNSLIKQIDALDQKYHFKTGHFDTRLLGKVQDLEKKMFCFMKENRGTSAERDLCLRYRYIVLKIHCSIVSTKVLKRLGTVGASFAVAYLLHCLAIPRVVVATADTAAYVATGRTITGRMIGAAHHTARSFRFNFTKCDTPVGFGWPGIPHWADPVLTHPPEVEAVIEEYKDNMKKESDPTQYFIDKFERDYGSSCGGGKDSHDYDHGDNSCEGY